MSSPFVPVGAPTRFERDDQGVDFRTTPGGPLVAPWDGSVSLASPNPGGFGTHYPLYTPSSGPYSGHTFYLGHTYAVTTGHVTKGQQISKTGTGSESWMGNAVGIPGHAEVGLLLPGGGYPSMSAGSALQSFVLGQSVVAGVTPGGGGGGFNPLDPTSWLQGILSSIQQQGVRMLLYLVLIVGAVAIAAAGTITLVGKPKGGELAPA